MKQIIPYAIIFLLLIYIICIGNRGRNSPGVCQDTITIMDTILVDVPVPKDSIVVKYIPITVPIKADSVPKTEENVQIEVDSVRKDSVSVQIPIIQKTYETEDYRAYVSGFRPSLDSLILFRSHHIIREKPHRWHIGPSVGGGFGSKGFQPFVGVTLTYSLFSF